MMALMKPSISKSLKIAHVVRRYSSAEWGGTETVVCHTVAEQRKLGHEPRIFCTAALQPSGAPPDGVSCFPYFYPYFPMPAADRLKLDKKGGSPYSPSLFRAVRDFRPDVIHIHAGGRLACAAVKLARRLGVPCVMSLHGGAAAVPASELAEMLKPLKGKFPYGGILDRMFGMRFDPLARVNAIICISHEEERLLKEKYPSRIVRYLPNGVDVEMKRQECRFPEEGPRLGEAALLPLRERPSINVLCVSRIDYQKNQLALVDLLAARPACRLTLVGPLTAQWYADKIKARVQELGVGDRITLIPGLPPGSAELEAAFAAADVFVLPSVHEPFGIVALEAMARGIPLIASNVGGLPDFVQDGKNGILFDPSAPNGLVDAFDRLVALPPARVGQMLKDARATVEGYAWPNVIARLMDIYDEVRVGRC
ncbi:MAG: glycosyltransferase family 4 protein [Kiritimatiellae bacterium]|nr:glycosyltransferase family 4 protein [Kiritimatiellia bacterium]